MSVDVHSCVRKGRVEGVKCDVNVEAIWVKRLGFKSEGQIPGNVQNKDMLMTLGSDKHEQESGRHGPGFF